MAPARRNTFSRDTDATDGDGTGASLRHVIVVGGTTSQWSALSPSAWRERVAELERKVKDAEERGNEVNTVIQTKIVKKIEQIHTNGENIITYVDREIVKYDDSCKIPAEAVKALNAAAQNQPVKETKAGNNLILKLAMMLQ